jgi:hypothetical protein
MLVKSGDYLPPETARPGLNPELYRVIRKAMSKSPADRYQKAEEMLVDVEQVMRLAFRPVGQTELQRWLADLSTKDGVPSLMRETPPAPDTIVDVVGARPGSKGQGKQGKTDGQVDGKSDGQDSGLVLDLGDAIEVTSGSPPPRPNQPKSPSAPNAAPYPNAGPTEVMAHPPDMSVPGETAAAEPIESVLPWYRRRVGVVVGAVGLVVVLIIIAKQLTTARGRAPEPVAATAPAEPPKAAPPPAPSVAEAPPPVPEPAKIAIADPAPSTEKAKDEEPKDEKSPDKAKQKKAKRDDGEGLVAEKGARPAKEEDPTEADEPPAKAHKVSPSVVSVTFKTDPEGARVATKNHVYGTTPQPAKLSPGTSYELTFTKVGYAPASKKYVAPSARSPQTLRVSLKKLPEPKKAAATPPPPRKGWFSR